MKKPASASGGKPKEDYISSMVSMSLDEKMEFARAKGWTKSKIDTKIALYGCQLLASSLATM